jgi:transposase
MLWISENHTLREQAHLTLDQRAYLIKEKFQLPHLSGRALLNYYRRLGVRYSKPQYQYAQKKIRR